jgi:hypothetical protein
VWGQRRASAASAGRQERAAAVVFLKTFTKNDPEACKNGAITFLEKLK